MKKLLLLTITSLSFVAHMSAIEIQDRITNINGQIVNQENINHGGWVTTGIIQTRLLVTPTNTTLQVLRRGIRPGSPVAASFASAVENFEQKPYFEWRTMTTQQGSVKITQTRPGNIPVAYIGGEWYILTDPTVRQ